MNRLREIKVYLDNLDETPDDARYIELFEAIKEFAGEKDLVGCDVHVFNLKYSRSQTKT